jgi:hypothetical protein
MAEQKLLINCYACANPVSVLADKCPSCGDPNNWQHPAIKNFYLFKDDTGVSDKFTFKSNKTEIWGETEKKYTWWMWLIVIICAIPSIAFGGIPGLFVAPVTLFVLQNVYGKKREFRANLHSGTWTSNDDEFWKPIRNILKIGQAEDAAVDLTHQKVVERATSEHQLDELAHTRSSVGLCPNPNCNAKISMDSTICPKCTASFGPDSAWRVKATK